VNPDILAIIESIQIFMDYLAQDGANLSPEAQQQLVEFIQNTTEFVEQYQLEQGINPPPTNPSTPTGGPVPSLDQAPFPSSNISRFKYDPESQNLIIQFLDKYPNANGPVYSYGGIPPYIFDVLRRGAVGPTTSGKNKWHAWNKNVLPSLGAAVNHLIKAGGFPYQRIR
jgi:hypothetical protein